MPAFLIPYLIGAIAALGLGGWLTLEISGRHRAEAAASAATAELRQNAAALAEVKAHAAAVETAMAGLAADTAARVARNTQTRQVIYAAAPSKACAAVPAIRAALDGLRRPAAAAGAGGAAIGAGGTAGLPAATGAARQSR